jgi:hypothetical protein
MELLMQEAQRSLEPARASVARLVDDLIVHLCGREVCARRARKLRRRGETVRFRRWTSTGKCRYSWIRSIRFVEAA